MQKPDYKFTREGFIWGTIPPQIPIEVSRDQRLENGNLVMALTVGSVDVEITVTPAGVVSITREGVTQVDEA